MKKNRYADIKIKDMIREAVRDPRADRVPFSLLPENIAPKLADRPDAGQKRLPKPAFRRAAALAASFLLVAAAFAVLPRLRSKVRGLEAAPASADGGERADMYRAGDVVEYALENDAASSGFAYAGGVSTETRATGERSVYEADAVPGSVPSPKCGPMNDTTEPESVEKTAPASAEFGPYLPAGGTGEADMIKTDGSYIFFITGAGPRGSGGSAFRIAETDGGKLTEVWERSDPGWNMREILLDGKKLALLMSGGGSPVSVAKCSGPAVRVEAYDISDPEAPELIREFEQEGSYTAASLDGGSLLLVSRSAAGNAACHEQPGLADGPFTSVSVTDLGDASAPVSAAVFPGAADNVCIGGRSVYVASAASSSQDENGGMTRITRISCDGAPEAAASVLVRGLLCEGGAMSEYGGALRIALSGPHSVGFRALGPDLGITGSLERPVPDGSCSVRFEGATAYASCPGGRLLTVDFSDPSAPSVSGEYTLADFPRYLYPYDADLILGFGPDRGGSGDFSAAALGLRGGTSAGERGSVRLGGTGAYSGISYDSRALLIDRDSGVVALPLRDGGENGGPVFNGVIVLSCGEKTGLCEKGRIPGSGLPGDEVRRAARIGGVLYTLSDRTLKATGLKDLAEISQLCFDK